MMKTGCLLISLIRNTGTKSLNSWPVLIQPYVRSVKRESSENGKKLSQKGIIKWRREHWITDHGEYYRYRDILIDVTTVTLPRWNTHTFWRGEKPLGNIPEKAKAWYTLFFKKIPLPLLHIKRKMLLIAISFLLHSFSLLYFLYKVLCSIGMERIQYPYNK